VSTPHHTRIAGDFLEPMTDSNVNVVTIVGQGIFPEANKARKPGTLKFIV
jgi:hypothetical protein